MRSHRMSLADCITRAIQTVARYSLQTLRPVAGLICRSRSKKEKNNSITQDPKGASGRHLKPSFGPRLWRFAEKRYFAFESRVAPGVNDILSTHRENQNSPKGQQSSGVLPITLQPNGVLITSAQQTRSWSQNANSQPIRCISERYPSSSPLFSHIDWRALYRSDFDRLLSQNLLDYLWFVYLRVGL